MTIDIKLRLYDFPSRVSSGLQSINCKDYNIDGKYLLGEVARLANVSQDRLTLVFCGRTIKPSATLKSTGFRSGHLIHVLYKTLNDDSLLPDIDMKRLEKIMASLHLIFLGRRQDHRRLKKNVSKLLTDGKRLQKIVDCVPGLKNEPVAVDILRHPDVFGHVVAPSNFSRVIKFSKRLGAAILLVWENTPATKSLKFEQLYTPSHNRATTASSDQNLHDENEDDDMEFESSIPLNSSPSLIIPQQRSNVITSNQLAQALSIANSPGSGRIFSPTASAMQTPLTGSSNSSSSGSGSRIDNNFITPDVFSRAMQQVISRSPSSRSNQTSVNNTPNPTPQLSPEILQNGLRTLRELGITDDRATREALIAANGDVEAAVNILFASGLQD